MVFLGSPGLGKENFRLTAKDREGRAKFVRGVGDKLAQLSQGNVKALEELIEGRGEASQLILGTRRGHGYLQGLRLVPCFRGRAANSLGHLRGLASQFGDGTKAPADIPRRNRSHHQEAERQKPQAHPPETSEHQFGFAGGRGQGKHPRLRASPERDEGQTQAAAAGVIDGPEDGPRHVRAGSSEVERALAQIHRTLKHAA